MEAERASGASGKVVEGEELTDVGVVVEGGEAIEA